MLLPNFQIELTLIIYTKCLRKSSQKIAELHSSWYLPMNLELVTSSPGFVGGASGKEPIYQFCRDNRHGFDPWVREITWRRVWQPTPVFLSGESHEQRRLVGYSPQSCRELDMMEAAEHTHIHNLVTNHCNICNIFCYLKCNNLSLLEIVIFCY